MINLCALSRIPFFLGHKEDEISYNKQIKRWSDEKESTRYAKSKQKRPVFAVITNRPSSIEYQNTIESLKYQTWTAYDIITINSSFSNASVTCSQVQEEESLPTRSLIKEYFLTKQCEWIIFLCQGDICSPSLLYSIMASEEENYQVMHWNILKGSHNKSGLSITHRNDTIFKDYSSMKSNKVWHSFATRGKATDLALRAFFNFYSPLHYFNETKGYTLKLRDYLVLESMDSRKHGNANATLAANRKYHTQALSLTYQGDFNYTKYKECEIALPSVSAKLITSIIMYRDKPFETIKCIQNVLKQRLESRLEIILVDNNSNTASKTIVREFIASLSSPVEIKTVKYDAPFNHSAQIIKALRHSEGEVIALINNDLFLEDIATLDHTSKWAMCKKIGSVGIVHKDSKGISHGGPIIARSTISSPLESIVEEWPDIPPWPVHTAGNSFAFCVVRRSLLERFSLDAFRFPNGYNDVAFCLSALEEGFEHIALGYLSATHLKSVSRGRTDETTQKILLRDRFPNLYLCGNQWELEHSMLRTVSWDDNYQIRH